jgi:acyl-CoA thioesterase-1
MSRPGFLLHGLCALLAACGAPPETATAPSATAPASAATVEGAPDAPVVAFLGDSLTAGLGLAEEEAHPAAVGELLARRGIAVRIVNGGISGDTSAGALERLDWLLGRPPAVLVVSIGANDGLRGMPVESLEANLRAIVRRARAAGARVLVTGQRIPINYGTTYARAFEAVYPRVAEEEGATLLPFLLEGVAMVPELNQPDGIHPTAEGQRRIARAVADALEPLLRAAGEDRASGEVEVPGRGAARGESIPEDRIGEEDLHRQQLAVLDHLAVDPVDVEGVVDPQRGPFEVREGLDPVEVVRDRSIGQLDELLRQEALVGREPPPQERPARGPEPRDVAHQPGDQHAVGQVHRRDLVGAAGERRDEAAGLHRALEAVGAARQDLAEGRARNGQRRGR